MNAIATQTAVDKLGFSSGLIVSTLLAFTAGFVDTCGFILLFSLFTAHVTGNFLLIGASLAAPRPGILARLLAFPAFILVVAVTQYFLLRCKRSGRDPALPALIAEAAFLALFLGVGVWGSPVEDADSAITVTIGMLGVAAMAVQNAASTSVFAAYAPTTIMTGNVTRAVMDAVEVVLGPDAAPAKARLRKMLPPIFGFALGAIAGGLGSVRVGFWCLIAPLLAILSVAGFHRSRSCLFAFFVCPAVLIFASAHYAA
jgi:uncharacterized membrane protein YoaK (UPF0700 family)